jgi:hypothetical protein
MDGKMERRVYFKFCVKLGKFATEIVETLREAFGEHSLSRRAVFEWHSRFNSCRLPIEDDERSRQRSSSKTTQDVERNSRTHPRGPSPNKP